MSEPGEPPEEIRNRMTTISHLADNVRTLSDSTPSDMWDLVMGGSKRRASATIRETSINMGICIRLLASLGSMPWPKPALPTSHMLTYVSILNLIIENLSKLELTFPRVKDSASANEVYRFTPILEESNSRLMDHLSRLLVAHYELTQIDSFPAEYRVDAEEWILDWRQRLESQHLVEDVRNVRNEAERALEATQLAAGSTGSTVLGEHFALYADAEGGRADRFRYAAMSCLVLVALLTGTLLLAGPTTSDIISALPRLALSIPVAVLAAYLGRESTKHRESERWARELQVQIRTFDSFIVGLPEPQRSKQREEFSRRIFGARIVSETSESTPSLGGEVASTLSNLVDVVKKLSDTKKESS